MKKIDRLIILCVATIITIGCATKKVPMPDPIVGVDIAEVTQGQPAPFNGTVFSPQYLNEYLSWDCKDEGKC